MPTALANIWDKKGLHSQGSEDLLGHPWKFARRLTGNMFSTAAEQKQ
jgi:hypothetical protein